MAVRMPRRTIKYPSKFIKVHGQSVEVLTRDRTILPDDIQSNKMVHFIYIRHHDTPRDVILE